MPGRTTSVAFLGNDADLNAVANRVAAKLRQTAVIAEESNAKSASSAEAAAAKIGTAYDAGTTKAARGLERLGALGGTFGLPMIESLDAVGKKLDETSAKHQKFVGTMAEAGKTALIAGAAGFAVAGAEAVKLGADYQKTTASIQANSDISAKAAKQVGDAFLATAGKSIFSAQELAGAYSQVAGQLKITEGGALSSAQAVKVMSAASDLAEASHAGLDTSTSALSATMQAYHLNVGQAVQASDTLFNVSRAMNVPIDGVATGLARLHGRLGILAPSLKDTAALMIELGQHGITGTRGVNVVNTAMQTLVGGSKNAQAVLKALGVNIFDANGKFIGMQGVISQLQPKLAGLTQHQQLFADKALFGAGAAQVMNQIIAQGVPKFEQASQAASKMGTTQGAAAAQSKTLQRQVDVLKATVTDLGTKFGLFLIPKLEAVAQATNNVIHWFGKHKAAAEVLGATIAGVLATAITVFAYTKAVQFVNATKDMIGGIGKLAGGIASAVPAILAKLGLISSTSAATAAEVEASNVAAGASFVALDAEVAAATTVADGQMALFAGSVATADTAIEASNAAAGLSFTALLGPIAAVAAAAAGVGYVLNKFGTPESQSSMPGPNGTQIPNPRAAPFLQHFGGGGGGVSTSGLPPLKAAPGSVSSWSGSQNAVAASLMTGFQNAGLSKAGAAAMVGNWMQESSLNPAEPGGFMAQWGGSRLASERGYAAAKHVSPSSISAQVGFAALELQNMPGLLQMLKTTTNPQAAALAISQQYERPLSSAANNPNREAQAMAAYLAFGGKVSGTLSATFPGGGGSGGGGGVGSGSSAIQALLNGPAAGGKAVMRYYKHKPVGVMTEAEWQAWQLAHGVGSPTSVRSLLYGNPLPGQTGVGRTDMGVDLFAASGSPVRAIGAGAIDKIIPNWYHGQPLVEERLTSGPNKGQYVYYAEQIHPGVHQGQTVRAGQQIGVVAPTGIVGSSQRQGSSLMLELGFGAGGGRTLAQATTGYREGQVTPAGQAFSRFLQGIGSGTYTTTTGGVTTGGGSNFGATFQQLLQQFISALQKTTTSLIQTYQNLEQSGTIKSLEKALGVNTTTRMPLPFGTATGGAGITGHGPYSGPAATVIRNIVEGLNSANITNALNAGRDPHQLDKALIPTLEKASNSSQATKAFNTLIAELKGSGQGGLASALTSARGGVFATLAQEMYAEQVAKDAESLNLQATQQKDLTTLQQNADAAQLNVLKATQQKQSDTLTAQVDLAKGQHQRTIDAMSAQVTSVKDMTQIVTDRFAAMAQNVEDSIQQMADSANSVVAGINDQTQIRVDVLGERGLYGLNLVAQKLRVQSDETKAFWNQQIALATMNLDTVTGQWHTAEQTAQLNVDQVTIQEDQRIALSQQADDTAHIAATLMVARVQQADDTVRIIQTSRIAAAQARVDALTLHEDTAVVGPAQIAVDLGATLPKAQQDILNAQLHRAQGQAGVAESGNQPGGTRWLEGITASANMLMSNADSQFQEAQTRATLATDAADFANQRTQQNASLMIANAQQILAIINGQATLAIDSAKQTLQGVQDQASIAEARATSAQQIASATASTQFAGSGLVVNIYGVPTNDAGAIESAMDWFARSQLQTS